MDGLKRKSIKHKKALKKTMIAGLICLGPMVFLYKVSNNFSGKHFLRDLEATPFLMKSHGDKFFTNQSLLGKVTLFAYIPQPCENCTEFITSLNEVHVWSKRALKKLEHFEESDVQLERVLVTSSDAAATLFGDWNKIQESAETLRDLERLFETCGDKSNNYVIVFDRLGKVKACVPQDEFKYKSFKALLSK